MDKVGPGHPPKQHQFKKGQSGNPKGKIPGTKNLSTIIKELENEEFSWDLVPIKDKAKAIAIGSPWRAIVYTALAKAYSGDTKAMSWLARNGYGDKLDITSNGETIAPKIISVIEPHVKTEKETTAGN